MRYDKGNKVRVIREIPKGWFGYSEDLQKIYGKVLVIEKCYMVGGEPVLDALTDDSYFYTVPISCVELVSLNVPLDKHVEAVREMLKTRSEAGFKKYGTNLERKDLKPSEWAQHALEECLDQANYLHRLKCDLEAMGK